MSGESGVLAQSVTVASTLTDLLTVTNPQPIVDAIYACNQDSVPITVRIAISVAGAAIAAADYLAYGRAIPIGETYCIDFPRGLRLGSGAVVRVYSSSASASFCLTGH